MTVRLLILLFAFPLLLPLPVSAAGCAYPADILNLTDWKETLPTGSTGSPTEIKQPALATYTNDPYFKVNATCDGVIFRAPTDGVTTSGSTYPRSELREMTGGGTANAAWTNTSGKHTMFIDQAIMAVPQVKKHVVVGQIHDGSSDVIVIRLEFPKLFVDIGGTQGAVLDANYTLGKRFTVQFVAENGKVDIYYNGSTTSSYTLNQSFTGAYFKAGAYTQSNCCTEDNLPRTCGAMTGAACGPNNFGEVVIYNVRLDHGTGLTPTPPGGSAPTATPVGGGVQPTAVPTTSGGSGGSSTAPMSIPIPSTWWVGLLFASFLYFSL